MYCICGVCERCDDVVDFSHIPSFVLSHWPPPSLSKEGPNVYKINMKKKNYRKEA